MVLAKYIHWQRNVLGCPELQCGCLGAGGLHTAAADTSTPWTLSLEVLEEIWGGLTPKQSWVYSRR